MDLHLAAMNGFYPKTGSIEEWNAAYYRLEDYLRAHRLTYKLRQSQIILEVLQKAAVRHELDQSKTPTQLALEEAYALIDQWFARLFPEEPEARASMVGRVALYILDATERWPRVFLASDHDLSPAFREALSEITVQSGPDLRVSSMVPRALDASPASEPVQ